jgi:hypothetical protein
VILDQGWDFFKHLDRVFDAPTKEDLISLKAFLTADKNLAGVKKRIRSFVKRVERDENVWGKELADLLHPWFINKTSFAQFSSRIIAAKLRRIDGLLATPLIRGPLILPPNCVEHCSAQQETVVEVVLKKLPMPSDSTPWERIFDFKADAEAQGYLMGLRVWMNELSRQALNRKEAEEKLEWLLFQHRQHLRLHKLTANRNTLSGIFVASMEIVEDLAKIKWGKAAKGIVSLFDRKTELLKAEVTSPAREVSYIIRANDHFDDT